MPELNAVTAFLVGAFAALAWVGVGIRKMMRSESFLGLTRKQRLVVWCVASISYFPSLMVALAGVSLLHSLVLRPGPWLHVAYNLTLALGLGIIGAALTFASAYLSARIARALSHGHARAAYPPGQRGRAAMCVARPARAGYRAR